MDSKYLSKIIHHLSTKLKCLVLLDYKTHVYPIFINISLLIIAINIKAHRYQKMVSVTPLCVAMHSLEGRGLGHACLCITATVC